MDKDRYKSVTHVIFDLDGLLLDTESLYYKLDSEVCARYGKEFTTTIKQKVMGRTELRSAEMIIEELKLPVTPEDYIKQQTTLAIQRLCDVELMPGVEKLLNHLHKFNIPFAIATGSNIQLYELKVQNYKKLFSLVDHVTAASSDPDVKEGKPAPDVFLVCAERFSDHPHPSKCLVFEDAPGGVTAAVKAGMQVVMVPDNNYITEDLKKHATLVLDSLQDFRPEWFGLPSMAGSDPDVKHGKPAPDVFLICAERFKDRPDTNKCLVFEDALLGVTTALRAGMQVIMVPDYNYVSKD